MAALTRQYPPRPSKIGGRYHGPVSNFPLLKLPGELIDEVVSSLDSVSADLLHLALACRQLSFTVLPFLYGHPTIETDRVTPFNQAMKDPVNACKVKHLTFWSEQTPVGALTPGLSKLTNLRDLWIYSPFRSPRGIYGTIFDDIFRASHDNGEVIERSGNEECRWNYYVAQDKFHDLLMKNAITTQPSERNFLNLQTLYLSYRDRNKITWILDHCGCFLSHSIRTLTIDGALFEDKTALSLKHYPRSTPLEYLYLKNCHMNDFALKRMLNVPMALKVLKGDEAPIGSSFSIVGGSTEPASKQPWLDAMAQQVDTLEEIDIEWLGFGGGRVDDDEEESDSGEKDDEDDGQNDFEPADFIAFEKLKRLRINSQTLIPGTLP